MSSLASSERPAPSFGTACASAALLGFLIAVLPSTAAGQYAESARLLPVVDGAVYAGTQLGSRLFIGGTFTHVAPPTGSAALFDQAGQPVPQPWPVIGGPISRIIPDTLGGWIAAGAFTSVNGQPHAGLVHVTATGEVDPRIRVVADGPVSAVALAHGRIYFVGPFTTVNGSTRMGLAAVDAQSGALSAWGTGFAARDVNYVASLAASSTGVYVSLGAIVGGGVWGLAASDGRVLFHRPPGLWALAPTSTRVYAAGYLGPTSGNRIVALDPLTGEEDPSWSSPVRFQYLSSTYGDRTFFSKMVMDGDAVYLAGVFRTFGLARQHLLSFSASSGELLPWQPDLAFNPSNGVSDVVLTASSVIALHGEIGFFSGPRYSVTLFDRVTAAATPQPLPVFGSINALATVPAGVVVGGWFGAFGGEERAQLAAIDLPTGTLSPWSQPAGASGNIVALDTDGAALFAGRTSNVPGPLQATLDKIDAADGHLIASLDLGGSLASYGLRLRVAGSRLFVWGYFETIGGHDRAGLAAIDIETWTVLPWATQANGVVSDLDVLGSSVYIAGRYTTLGGVPRQGLAAVDVDSGDVLPWNPEADLASMSGLRVQNGRVIVGGAFRRIAGVRRRSLAALDAVSAQATPWNPDVPPGINQGIRAFTLDAAGIIYVSGGPLTTIGGRQAAYLAAVSADTGARLPWRSPEAVIVSPFTALPDCLFIAHSFSTQTSGVVNNYACLPPLAPPPALNASVSGPMVSLSWPAVAQPHTAYRVEVGRRAEQTDVGSVTLEPDATGISGSLPAGSYVARVRTVADQSVSMPSPEVSFAIAPPDVPGAPLDLTTVTEGLTLRLSWTPPTVGVVGGYRLEVGSSEGSSNVASLDLAANASVFTLDAPPGVYWARLRAVGPSGGVSAPSNEVFISIDGHSGGCVSTPLPPFALAASVSARTVTLTWQQPSTGPVPNAQRIVVGSSPGGDNLGIFEVPGPATRFEAPAPTGTYYVRLFAFNECGASPVSNEVQVVVP